MFVKDYLQNRYSSDFELMSLNRENAPGEKFRNYAAKFRSLSHDRKTFYVTFTEKEDFDVKIDQFPTILLEKAFLEVFNIENDKDIPVVFELEDQFVMGDYLDGINNLEDAKTKLNSIEESSWKLYIYAIVDNPEDRMAEVEEKIANLLQKAYGIMPSTASINVYIYDDPSLTKADIQPDMNVGIIKRTKQKTKIFEQWRMGWTPKKLKASNYDFRTVVEKREVLPSF